MLELVKTFLAQLPGTTERIEKSNSERLWLRGTTADDDVRKVSSYPSSVKTLKPVTPVCAALLRALIFFLICDRGVGGDVIICEEAAAMDTAVFYARRIFCSTVSTATASTLILAECSVMCRRWWCHSSSWIGRH